MTGADDIRESLRTAEVLAFPRPGSRVEGRKNPEASGSGGGGEGGGAPAAPDDGDLPYAFYPMTDLANAERMAERYRDRLRFCPARGWLAWDGKRWTRETADEQVKLAEHATARAIQDEAEALANSGQDFKVGGSEQNPVFLSDKLRKWGRASEGAQKLAAMSKRAAAMLAIAVEALDRDPMKINVANGTLVVDRDIAGGYIRLQPHDPADYITRLAPVAYDPDAACPLYDHFLEEIQPAADMRAFLHAWFGYSLTGDTGEQKMAFLYGTGRNGKGVLVGLMSHIAGSYADSISIESFLDSGRARAGGQATPDLADLPGVRLLSTSEPKKGAQLDEAMIKLFTGGDVIKARHLNRDYFAFVPCAKLTMQGNYRPKVRDTDEGMWSRLKLVPFDVFVPKERRDPKLVEKLKGEASGVLNRMLDGVRAWLDAGRIVFPDAVDAATATYRADSDPLGRFLETCVTRAEGESVRAHVMHETFVAWAKASGESVWSMKGLGQGLRDRGFASKASDGVHWLGVKLVRHVHDFVETGSQQPGGGGGGGAGAGYPDGYGGDD